MGPPFPLQCAKTQPLLHEMNHKVSQSSFCPYSTATSPAFVQNLIYLHYILVVWNQPVPSGTGSDQFVEVQSGRWRTRAWMSSWGRAIEVGWATGFCKRKEWWLFLDSASALWFSTPGMCTAQTLSWCFAMKSAALLIKCIALSSSWANNHHWCVVTLT